MVRTKLDRVSISSKEQQALFKKKTNKKSTMLKPFGGNMSFGLEVCILYLSHFGTWGAFSLDANSFPAYPK